MVFTPSQPVRLYQGEEEEEREGEEDTGSAYVTDWAQSTNYLNQLVRPTVSGDDVSEVSVTLSWRLCLSLMGADRRL